MTNRHICLTPPRTHDRKQKNRERAPKRNTIHKVKEMRYANERPHEPRARYTENNDSHEMTGIFTTTRCACSAVNVEARHVGKRAVVHWKPSCVSQFLQELAPQACLVLFPRRMSKSTPKKKKKPTTNRPLVKHVWPTSPCVHLQTSFTLQSSRPLVVHFTCTAVVVLCSLVLIRLGSLGLPDVPCARLSVH